MSTDYVCLTNIFMVGSMKVAHKYSILNRIGGGKFGQVFAGKNERTGEYVAIKMEPNSEYSLLKHESTILNYLYSKLCRNTPPVYWFGQYENPAISSSPVTALVIPLYTESFADFMNHRHHDHDHDDDDATSSMSSPASLKRSRASIRRCMGTVPELGQFPDQTSKWTNPRAILCLMWWMGLLLLLTSIWKFAIHREIGIFRTKTT